MDQNAKQQIAERIKDANNVLITVSANPSVDQLAACIGLTLLVNKLGKHGTAVFSGEIPSTIEFLKPEDTLETNTNSLRDFIIALDKSKADKLRYKVEDKVVKIFITPYRTSLGQDDLIFSQGDFNVDVVIGLGVHEREDLDQAITAHGRILHDATVISVNNHDQGNLGAINWVDLNASSLSEMVLEIVDLLTRDGLDGQMATALMTGIVAETERFSNERTTPRTMTLASQLLGAGANQQLIASKLEEAQPIPEDKGMGEAAMTATSTKTKKKNANSAAAGADGSLQIAHDKSAQEPQQQQAPMPPSPASMLPPLPPPPPQPIAQLPPTPAAQQQPLSGPPKPHLQYTNGHLENPSNLILQPPTLGGKLTANTVPEQEMDMRGIDPLGTSSLPQAPLLNRNAPPASAPPQLPPLPPSPPILQQPPAPMQQPYAPQPMMPPPPQFPQPMQPMPSAPPPPPPPPPPQPLPPMPPPQQQQPLQSSPEPMAPSAPAPEDKAESVEDAREAVEAAIKTGGSEENLEPIVALGAQPVNLNLRDEPQQETGGIPAAAFQPTPAPPSAGQQSFPSSPPPLGQSTNQLAEPPIGSTLIPAPPEAPSLPSPDDSASRVYTPQILNPTTPPPNGMAPPPPVPPPMMPAGPSAPGQDGIAL